MSPTIRGTAALKLAAALSLALSIAACSSTPDQLADGAGGPGGRGGYGAGGAGTPGSAQDFVVNVGDRVFFESDSSDLTPTATATLDRQAQWLSRYPRYVFVVEGHADERGTREYNFSLGARRGQTVRDYLASRGINSSRMRTVSYGKERPVAVCNDISCWSQNRRAVTVLDTGAGS
ncbi:MAG TPA: peptidoglycan-associated lipoprotein Pal [Enterovirga sp.]